MYITTERSQSENRPQVNHLPAVIEDELNPWLLLQAEKQKKAKFQFFIVVLISLILLISLLVYTEIFKIMTDTWDYLPYLVIPVYLFMVFYLAWSPLSKVNQQVKSRLIELICGQFSLHYNENTTAFPIDVFRESNILPKFEKVRSFLTDYFAGTYKNIDFSVVEAKLNDSRGVPNNTSSSTIFKGLLIYLSMSKKSKGRLLIREKRGLMSDWFMGKHKMEPVVTGHDRFDQRFNVLASSNEDAKAFLSSSLTDSLLALTDELEKDTRYKKGLSFALQHNNLLVTIPAAKAYFSYSSFRAVTDPARTQNMIRGISLVFDTIDALADHL